MKISQIQLIRIRSVYRLSMAEMANALGCTSSYVNRLEKSKDVMSPAIQARIIEVFKLNPNKMRAISRAYKTYTMPVKKEAD